MKIKKCLIFLGSLGLSFSSAAAVISCNNEEEKKNKTIYKTPSIYEETLSFIKSLSNENPGKKVVDNIKTFYKSIFKMLTEAAEPNQNILAKDVDFYIKDFSYSFIKENLSPAIKSLIENDSVIKKVLSETSQKSTENKNNNKDFNAEKFIYEEIKNNKWLKMRFKGTKESPNEFAKKIGNLLWTLGDRMTDEKAGDTNVEPNHRGFVSQEEAEKAKWITHAIAKILKDNTAEISSESGINIDIK